MTMQEKPNRKYVLDAIRGLTILSMIGFHTCWDLYYFSMGITADMLFGRKAYIWQQSICYTFILLSGYCFSFGYHHLKRGLLSLLGGIVISIVTMTVIPDERDLFGVLWLLGSSMLVMILPDRLFAKIKSSFANALLLLFFLILFVITRNVNSGFLGFEGLNLVRLPEKLYNGYFMTYLGFPDPTFYSSDYFSFIPWFFLFCTGYFLEKVLRNKSFVNRFYSFRFKPLEFMGRHSFVIYMLHQVVIYGVVFVINMFIR